METGQDLQAVICCQDGLDLGSRQCTGLTAEVLAFTDSQQREFFPISPRNFFTSTSE
jgi:hypothetical protein